MIAGVRGTLTAHRGDSITVATPGGVSYDVALPLGVLERLPAEGSEVDLKTVLVVRDDGWLLFGFDSDHERTLFQRLLGATGIGPRLALALLSTLGGTRVVQAIKGGDIAALCVTPGIGKKTAERMVIELKDRLGELPGADQPATRSLPAEQAVQALLNLGYGAADADRAVRAAVAQDGAGQPVDLIRRALHVLTKGS
ncbi:MAG TPA: Holliday junction branch migration protein RuvA [Gemmatimonadales bacterium]|jgi:Holliday junction DNA helicase RuvA